MAPAPSPVEVFTSHLFLRATTSESALPSSDKTCGPRPQSGEYASPFSSSNDKFLNDIQGFTAALTLFSLFCMIYTVWGHLHNYTRPSEQRQIIRIVFFPFVITAVSMGSILDYSLALYLPYIYNMYEAFCFACIFLLISAWACEDPSERDQFFQNLQRYDRQKNPIPGGSFSWFKYTWLLVLQYPFFAVTLDLISIVTQYYNVFCSNSYSPKYAHVWTLVISLGVLGTAIGQLIFFALRLIKGGVISSEHRPSARFWSFKIPVFLFFAEEILFSIVLKHIPYDNGSLTYSDVYFGVPELVHCIEGAIISAVYVWSYSAKEYRQHKHEGTHQHMGFFRAIFDALDLTDVVLAVLGSFAILLDGSWKGGSTARRHKNGSTTQQQQQRRGPVALYNTTDGNNKEITGYEVWAMRTPSSSHGSDYTSSRPQGPYAQQQGPYHGAQNGPYANAPNVEALGVTQGHY